MVKKKGLKVVSLPLSMIDEPGGIVRLEINPDAIEELARSINEIGLLIPIGVRGRGARYEIVDGHRRYLAHKLLKRKEIPCFVRDVDDVECAVARATENLGRVDLSPVEEAATYADLRDTYNLSNDEIGKRMGKSPGVVKRRLDLLKMLPQLQKAVHLGQISYSVAEELSRLRDPGKVDYYLGYAVDHGITQAVARQWVNDELKRQRTNPDGAGGTGGVATPLEDKPIYIPCDVCHTPVVLGDDTVIRCCRECTGLIAQAVAGGKNT